jgi:hypothetical protein
VAPRLLLRDEFEPDHAQLEFGEVNGDYPQWGFGGEPVVANDAKVVVATLPESEGKALVEVWAADRGEPIDGSGVLVYDGRIVLSGDDAEVGTFLGGRLELVQVGPGEHRVQVFVDEPGYATRLSFVVTPHVGEASAK